MTKCSYCGREIRFVRTENGKMLPINTTKLYYKPGGKERLVIPGGKVVAATFCSKWDPGCKGFGYTAHFSTCTKKPEKKKDDGEQIELF